VNPVRGQIVDRGLLGRVEVAGGDDFGPAAPQRQQQRNRLRLEVDAGADRQVAERLGASELLADLGEQPAVLDHPFDAVHRTD
jgi:hypothetical protein